MSVCVSSADLEPVLKASSLLRLTELELRAEVQLLMARIPDLSTNGIGQGSQSAEAHRRARGVLTSSEDASWSSVKKAVWALRRVWGRRGTRDAGPREPPREGRTKP